MQEEEAKVVREIRARLEEYLRDKGKAYRFNPDSGTVDSILTAMAKRREKFGKDYCPCRRVTGDAEKDELIVCPCVYHQEEIERDGHCHCYLFTSR